MKETINYYQKLYESAMAFAMRKVLREEKKKKKLINRSTQMTIDIENLTKMIKEKENEISNKEKE